jgi:hypothetical protein
MFSHSHSFMCRLGDIELDGIFTYRSVILYIGSYIPSKAK